MVLSANSFRNLFLKKSHIKKISYRIVLNCSVYIDSNFSLNFYEIKKNIYGLTYGTASAVIVKIH